MVVEHLQAFIVQRLDMQQLLRLREMYWKKARQLEE